MPGYPKHPSRWLGGELAATKSTAKALSASGTQYVPEPIITAEENDEGHHYEEKCVAIIGDVSADNEGNATGLEGWGVAVLNGGVWVKLPGSTLTPTAKSANYTAESGQMVLMSGAYTVTLPSPSSGRVVGVSSVEGSGTSPVTVKTPSGAILGPGVAASATSILLGSKGAYVTLEADGTNWHIIAGQQDSGWITITPSGTWENYIGLGYRLVGNLVRLRGTTNKGTSGTTVFTLPVGYRPVQITVFLLGNVNGEVDFPGLCNLQPTTGVVYGYFSTPAAYSFDGLTFTVD